MRVRYTLGAFYDRERIFERLHRRSESGARNVMARVKAAVQQLSEQPYSGHKTNVSGALALVLADYPSVIFYRVRQNIVELLHIRHTSRRPKKVGKAAWVSEKMLRQ
jgi:plasmid stabilization system protein ParE